MKLSLRDKESFFHQFSRQLESGIPAMRALEMLATGRRGREGAAARALLAHPESALAPRFAATRGWFSALDAALIAAGERGGRLAAVLNLLSEHYKVAADARSVVIRHSAYPIILFHLAALLLALPAAFSADRPAVFVQSVAWTLGIFYLAGILLFAALRLTTFYGGRSAGFDRVLLTVPMAGFLRQINCSARLATVLAVQVRAGVGILGSLRPAAEASGSAAMRSAAERIPGQVRQGLPLGSAFQAQNLFPRELVSAIQTGEESGRLDSELERAALLLRQQHQKLLEAVATWSPKILYSGVAIYVGIQIIQQFQGYFQTINSLLDM